MIILFYIFYFIINNYNFYSFLVFPYKKLFFILVKALKKHPIFLFSLQFFTLFFPSSLLFPLFLFILPSLFLTLADQPPFPPPLVELHSPSTEPSGKTATLTPTPTHK